MPHIGTSATQSTESCECGISPYGFASSEHADDLHPRSTTSVAVKHKAWIFSLGTIFILAYAPVFLRDPQNSDWYLCFIRAAQRMQQGATIHVIESRPYAYPPIMALLTVPFSRMPLNVAFAAWYAVNVFALCLLVVFAWRLADGASWRSLNRRDYVTVTIGLLLMSRFLLSPLETRQFDLVIAALLIGGLLAIRNGRDTIGPLAVGLAAGMKCTPLIFLPYLAWSGRWKCACLVMVTSLAANIAPDICFPQSSGRWYLEDWKSEVLDVAREMPPGTWFSGLVQNQSVAGELQRVFRYGIPTSLDEVRTAKLAQEMVPALRVIYVAVCAALVLLVAVVIRSAVGSERPRPDSALSDSDFRRYAAEVSTLLALMLLLSPMTSRAHFVVLIVPVFLATRTAIARPRSGSSMALLLLLICGPLVSKGIVGPVVGELALAVGLPVLFALTCLLFSLRVVVTELWASQHPT